jgi:hypothetical protein
MGRALHLSRLFSFSGLFGEAGMKWPTLLIALVLAAGCAKGKPHVAPTRHTFVDLPAAESGVTEKEDEMDITIPAFNPLTAAGGANQVTALFRGADRKGAKTSIASGSREQFGDLAALVATLPSDDNMRHHTPPIARDTMTRATEEARNVRVPAWIYAVKYEADQDWHVILGTDPSASGARTFFNGEVSGLPASSATAFSTLKQVRTALSDILSGELPSGTGYRTYAQPIAVIVEGSLFFDVDHAAGVVGPTAMRPKTAWEIHPITKLVVQ